MSNYLEHIASSRIMTKASRYDIRRKHILTKMDKYYLTDMGLGRMRNTGFKLENVVYKELLVRGYEVYVGKTRNGEIDFSREGIIHKNVLDFLLEEKE